MSTSSKESKGAASPEYRITAKSSWSGAWKTAGMIGAGGLGIAAYGWWSDPARFAYSYLFGFVFALSLALGSLFFVLVQHITKASWGVTVRRVAELFMRPMALFAVLVVPLVFTLTHLFPWAHPNGLDAKEASAEHQGAESKSPLEEARGYAAKEPAAMRDVPVPNPKRMERAEEGAESKIVDHKRFYLSRRFFLFRLFLYLVAWWWLSNRYFQWSTDQDKTKALENTAASQSFAPAGLIIFAFTLTFFAFDWLLSLDATWYSTIFGVQFFAQCALFQIASLILWTLMLRRSALLGNAVNVEHYHDLGKLLFGWIVFWSYISFAQFFLTWYSNIPDEVAWFHQRWGDNGGTWKATSLALVVFNFFLPFWFLMSRNIKRRLPLLAAGAICIVVMHAVEVYWIVMPNRGPLDPSIVDLGCLVGITGVYLAAVLHGMEQYALVAVGDPRLSRALEFENA
ncbi:MAG: hypothetical protein ACLP1X_20965 [Polyangiaceae bacterium]